jgi:hypothetical protein
MRWYGVKTTESLVVRRSALHFHTQHKLTGNSGRTVVSRSTQTSEQKQIILSDSTDIQCFLVTAPNVSAVTQNYLDSGTTQFPILWRTYRAV